MKKLSKALVALGTTAAMAATGFAGASSAFAEDGVALATTQNITINNTVAGDEFAGYRLLNIQSEDEAGKKFVYLVNDTYRDAIKAGINAVEATKESDKKTPEQVAALTDKEIIKYLEGLEGANEAAGVKSLDTFAKGFMNSFGDTNPAADFTKKAQGTSVTVEDQQVGYYLISQTKTADDTHTGSKYMVGTNGVKDALTVTLKNGTVTLEKKTDDVNDSTGDKTTGFEQDSADYDLGDDVPFQLTGTLPANYDSYDTFKYVFTDTLSKGLTFNKDSVEVFVKNGETETKLATGFTVSDGETVADEGEYKGGTKFTVSFDNLKDVTGVTKDSTIIVRYNATLNENAVIGAAGNPNKANITFTNTQDGKGEGTTPDDKNIIFTYQLDVDKVDGDNNPLAGAGFTLFKFVKSDNGTDKGTWKKIGDEITAEKNSDNKYVASFQHLDDGVYKLVETTIPDGFNKADDKIFTITAGHTNDDAQNPLTLTMLKIDETDGDTTTGVVGQTVINTAGSKLPSTGGMGTTILYTVGALIVLAAGAGLAITMRRRNA